MQLLLFSIAMTVQAVRIARERDRANVERDRANQEAETAKQVSEFLEGLFKVSDPSEARGNSITAREILDQGAERIERDLRGAPAIQSRLMLTMGNVYQGLGLHDKAEPILRRAAELRRETFGRDSLEYAEALSALGWAYTFRGVRSDAPELQQEALVIIYWGPESEWLGDKR